MKKTNLLRWIALSLLVLILAGCLPLPAQNLAYANISPVHAVRIDYGDPSKSSEVASSLEKQIRRAGANMVSIPAGRADWTYFPWKGHSADWSSDVQETGDDFLARDSRAYRKWAHVNAVVDVLAPRYIQQHPETAAISWLGTYSANLVSTMNLVNGDFGRTLLGMIDAIAAKYPVNSITITEMVYYVDGYGPDDLAAYRAATGSADWPRLETGQINIDDPNILAWRTGVLAQFLDQAAAIVHKYNKQLYLEVRAGFDDQGNPGPAHEMDFNTLLQHVDKLVVWGNYDLKDRPVQDLSAVAAYLSQFPADRVILEVGLWRNDPALPLDTNRVPIPAKEFQGALDAARQAGITNVLVSPSLLMEPDHWAVLTQYWK